MKASRGRRIKSLALLGRGLLFAAIPAFSACGLGDFDPQSLINSVRILGSRADKPYAKPGDTVTFEVLSYDGRVDKSRPMKIFWVPQPCINPVNDTYYACFAALSGRAKPGDNQPPSALRPGVDLTPFLPQGPTFSVTVPTDIIDKHPPLKGVPDKYGLEIVFNIACAGHLELVEIDPNNINPQTVPIGCFDANGNRLEATEYVFGYTRAYVYDTRTNANPTIDKVRSQDADVDLSAGITVPHCTTAKRADCPKVKLEIVVPDSAWELNPGDLDGGNTRHEQLWATYYVTMGQLEADAKLLFDTKAGRVTGKGSENNYLPPNEAGEGKLWIVVHDNRGGAAWVEVPLHVN